MISISESGGYYASPPPMPERGGAMMDVAARQIVPEEQRLRVNLSMVFELQ